MKSFVIGTVLEPEVQLTRDKKAHVNFGFLVGKNSVTLDVWEDDKCYERAASLREGDRVLLVVNGTVDKRNQLRYYINDITEAPEGLRQSLLALFQPAAPKVEVQPEQAQNKKAG